MKGDCAFRMGRSHRVCQDYAVAGSGERPYVIVADGCSSSPDTDIGARLLARLTERALQAKSTDFDLERVVRRAGRVAAYLGLHDCCLDATLLTARVLGERWHLMMAGDGVAAWQDHEGRVHVRALSYTGGYPEYPSYLASPERRRSYAALPSNHAELRRMVLEPDGRVSTGPTEALPGGPYRESGLLREAIWLALLSDGATSFVARDEAGGRTGTVPIGLEAVLATLLRFKSLQGVFVQRRMVRFALHCSQQGWCHQDDLALGAIYFGN